VKKAKEADSVSLVREARRLAGEADQDATPLTDEERAIMDEVRREHRRPSKEEIHKEAKRLQR